MKMKTAAQSKLKYEACQRRKCAVAKVHAMLSKKRKHKETKKQPQQNCRRNALGTRARTNKRTIIRTSKSVKCS